MSGFLLCDPALMMPPPEDVDGAVYFWKRLIEWSVDRRLRLGPSGHEMVVALLGTVGWPKRDVANYPPGLGQLAHRALATMLKQVAVPSEDVKPPNPPPSLMPPYRAHPMGEMAISVDAFALYRDELYGVATDIEHWGEQVNTLRFEPPPPESLEMFFKPGGRTLQEIDRSVEQYLSGRRLTIVGGIPADRILAEIENRFGIDRCDIRWIGSEPGARLNLSSLDGLRARVDVVYCITGHIGHDGSTKAKKCCRKRGIRMRKINDGNDILDDLCARHGSD